MLGNSVYTTDSLLGVSAQHLHLQRTVPAKETLAVVPLIIQSNQLDATHSTHRSGPLS